MRVHISHISCEWILELLRQSTKKVTLPLGFMKGLTVVWKCMKQGMQ